MFKMKSEYDYLDKYDYYGNIFYFKKNDLMYYLHNSPINGNNEIKQFYSQQKLHRLDGPAVIYRNGKKVYYINNELLTEEQFEYHPERLKFLGKDYLACIK